MVSIGLYPSQNQLPYYDIILVNRYEYNTI